METSSSGEIKLHDQRFSRRQDYCFNAHSQHSEFNSRNMSTSQVLALKRPPRSGSPLRAAQASPLGVPTARPHQLLPLPQLPLFSAVHQPRRPRVVLLHRADSPSLGLPVPAWQEQRAQAVLPPFQVIWGPTVQCLLVYMQVRKLYWLMPWYAKTSATLPWNQAFTYFLYLEVCTAETQSQSWEQYTVGSLNCSLVSTRLSSLSCAASRRASAKFTNPWHNAQLIYFKKSHKQLQFFDSCLPW